MNDAAAETNLLNEKLISFSQAAGLLPPSRKGKPVSPSCVWRWFRHGVRVNASNCVRLEAVRVARRHLTSVEAVKRFIAAQQATPIIAKPSHFVSRNKRSEAEPSKSSKEAHRQLLDQQKKSPDAIKPRA